MYLRRGGTKASSHNENPCAQQIACKTFNIEILQFWRSPNCTERFEADILKLCWWLTYLQPLEQYIFLHLFVSLARNRTEGGPIPYCSKLPAHNTFKIGVLLLEQAGNITTESIRLPAQNTFKIGVLQLQQTRKSIYAQHGPDMIQKRRVPFGPGKGSKGTRRSWLNISSTWHEYMAPTWRLRAQHGPT